MGRGAAALPEGWDYSPDRWPERVRLVAPEPIGVGTPSVEALTSWVPRLAIAHDLPASHLARLVVAPALGRAGVGEGIPDEWGRYLSGIFRRVRGSLNGHGSHAATWVAALEQLTGRSDVRFLTMLPWAEVVPDRALMHADRRVCPICLAEGRGPSDEPYEPLIWHIAALEICPIHEVRLESACSSCGRITGVLGTWARPGRCGRCGTWRGGSRRAAFRGGDLAWQRFVAREIGGLIANAPTLVATPEKNPLALAIREAIWRTGLTQTDFGREIGVSVGLVSMWRSGQRIPSLAASLRICALIGIPLVEFVCGNPASSRARRPALVPPPMPPQAVIDWHRVEDEMRRATMADSPPSLRSVARQAGIEVSWLRLRLPGLSAEVRDRHRAWRGAKIRERRERECETVAEAMHRLDADGIYPGRAQVERVIGRPHLLRKGHARDEWKQGLADRGLLLAVKV